MFHFVLCPRQGMYFNFFFILNRVRELNPQRLTWSSTPGEIKFRPKLLVKKTYSTRLTDSLTLSSNRLLVWVDFLKNCSHLIEGEAIFSNPTSPIQTRYLLDVEGKMRKIEREIIEEEEEM